jgi:hypothetical protein
MTSLKGLLEEVQDIEGQCIRLVEKQMGKIQTELRALNTLQRWSRAHASTAPAPARFVDAEG